MKKILLCCTAQNLIDRLVKSMNQAAEELELNVQIETAPINNFYYYVEEFDVFLLGPDASFKRTEIAQFVDRYNKKVEVIDREDCEMINGRKVLDYALKLIEEDKEMLAC